MMNLTSFFAFVLIFTILQACSFEEFSKIFFDEILNDTQNGRIEQAIAKAHRAPFYDPNLCSKSKICSFRINLIQHLMSIPDIEGFDDSLSEFPLFESVEVAVREWELYLQAAGELTQERFNSGKDFIEACPTLFLKYFYEKGTCSLSFYNRLFLNSYQRDLLRGRPELAVKRAKEKGIPAKLRDAGSTSAIARKQVTLIEQLQMLRVGENVTKEAVVNPLFDTVAEAVSGWHNYFSSLLMANVAPVDSQRSQDNQDFSKSLKSHKLKWDVAERFIRSCPFFFTKKFLPSNDQEAFKTIFGLHIIEDSDVFDGDGELITFYDDFTHNHGKNVASVACDLEFGLARGSTFESRSCHNDFVVSFTKIGNQRLTTPVHTLTTQQFSSVQAEWTLYPRMVVKIDGEVYEFGNQTANPPHGEIVNCSFGDIRTLHTAAEKSTCYRLAQYRFLSYLLSNCAIVFAAGNEYMDLASLSEYNEMMKSFANIDGSEYFGLFNVVALEEDALTLSFSNQPGKDQALQRITVCAPGSNVEVRNSDGSKTKATGSSFATPFVSAMIAIIRSNLIMPVNHLICQSIQKTATPIVMRRSRKRLYDIPVALVDVTAGNLEAGKTYHYIPFEKTEPKPIYVDQVMIDEGRKRYGMGRVHLERALNMAIEMHGGKRKIKQVQP